MWIVVKRYWRVVQHCVLLSHAFCFVMSILCRGGADYSGVMC
jgi:hypothetical protein